MPEQRLRKQLAMHCSTQPALTTRAILGGVVVHRRPSALRLGLTAEAPSPLNGPAMFTAGSSTYVE